MKKLLVTLAVLAVASASPAFAQSDNGFTAALRAGYAVPLGDAFDDATTGVPIPLNDQFTGAFPLWVDVGYRFAKRFFVGAYFQYGIALVNSDVALGGACGLAGVSCSGYSMRFGVEFLFSFLPDGKVMPWGGVGAGYEISSLAAKVASTRATLTVQGWEFFNVQLGADFKLSPLFALGPYVAFSLCQFDKADVTGPGTSVSVDIANKGIHQWLQFGLKGTMNL